MSISDHIFRVIGSLMFLKMSCEVCEDKFSLEFVVAYHFMKILV